jgi:3-(3-hydroxy-phenyl)propionate hydroxylase
LNFDERRTQILIVGAGPVGTVAAYYLAKHGVDVLILEQGQDCAQDLRASTFHPPTLEMLDQLDLAQELIRMGLKAPIFQWRERNTGEIFQFDLDEIKDVTKFPFRIQCEQYHLSGLLAERLDEMPNAEVLFGHRLLNFEQCAEGVIAYAEGPLDIQKFRADYLIGADGANSIVRKWLGTEFSGFTYPEKFLCLTTGEPLETYLTDLCHVNYVADSEEWAVLLRVPSMWRVLVPASESEEDSFLVSDEKCRAVFDRLIGKPETQTYHRTIYRVHQRVAKQFRDGRVSIIGDAAHLNNPLGGFGMNSGIHDAFNLCEKLVEIVIHGASPDPLLDKFERQRREVTHNFTQSQTIQNMEYMKQGDADKHALKKSEMLALTQDPIARREYMLRQSMIQSLKEQETIR